MNKGELVDRLAERLGDKRVAARAIDDLLDIINRAVAKGEKVSITGFGTFEKLDRAARTGRNPRTGETVKLRKRSVPKFRPGAHLKAVASGAVKLGREPKPQPLLPGGITSVRAQKALAEVTTAPAAAAKKTATAAKRTAGATKTAAKATAEKATAKKATAARATTRKATVSKAAAAKKSAKKSAAKTSARRAAGS